MSLSSEILDWINERPVWLRKAYSLLSEKNKLDGKDIETLADICYNEANSIDLGEFANFQCSQNSLQSSNEDKELCLLKVSNITGINRLAPKNPLIFKEENDGKNLTIVYGDNGVGKSGYVRLLKHICKAKDKGSLYNNIYENNVITQKCDVDYLLNGQHKRVSWENGIESKDLQSIEIYDRYCGDLYVNRENELTYEPKELSIFTELIKSCDEVRECLETKKNKYIKTKLTYPPKFSLTDQIRWYNTINESTPKNEVELKSKWEESDEISLNIFKTRLLTPDPLDKVRSLKNKVNSIIKFIKEIRSIQHKLSPESITQYYLLKKDLKTKSDAADLYKNNFFNNSSLAGIGSAAWKKLWEHAKSYSEQYAYPHEKFPVTKDGARCVLCQQPLSIDASKRFLSFDEFINSTLEKELKDASTAFEMNRDNILDFVGEENFDLKLAVCCEGNQETVDKGKTLYKSIIEYADKLSNEEQTFFDIGQINPLLYELIKIAKEYRKDIKIYEEDAKNIDRQALEQKVSELEVKKWLFDNKANILDEISSLKEIAKCEKAISKTNTSSLTRKKSEISGDVISENFKNRFVDELKELNAKHINVELIKSRNERGHIYHKIILSNTPPNKRYNIGDILSEGEFRIVSLAAFFADVHQQDNKSPFVFDDPITSLDYHYETATVKRLIKLSMTRQVIVFTHRLSLLSSLISNAIMEPNQISLMKESWGCGEPTSLPFSKKNPQKALNHIKNDFLAKAKNIYEGSREAYEEKHCDFICLNFRIILEKIIEGILLNDIIQRHRFDIQTKGKLSKLPKIKIEDTDYLDELMTKYSRNVHSQSQEAPITYPTPGEIEEDVDKLIQWIEEFTKRS